MYFGVANGVAKWPRRADVEPPPPRPAHHEIGIPLAAFGTAQQPRPIRYRHARTKRGEAKMAGAKMEDIRPGRVPLSPEKTRQATTRILCLPAFGAVLRAFVVG